MQNLIPYDYSGKTIRIIVDQDGNYYWIGKDVCCALGFSKYRDVLKTLDRDERVSMTVDTPGGKQAMTAVNEPGLYRLLSRSTKKRAAKFQRWVFHNILPEIRKTGSYSVDKPELPTTKLGWMKLAVESEEAKEKLQIENNILLPKAKALDEITDTTSLKSLTEAAKVMSIKPKELIRRLEITRILYRKRNRQKTLLPYQYYLDNNWFAVKIVGPDKKYTQTLITPKGIAKLRVRYCLQ